MPLRCADEEFHGGQRVHGGLIEFIRVSCPHREYEMILTNVQETPDIVGHTLGKTPTQ